MTDFKIFPTEPAGEAGTPGRRRRIAATALYPITGLITGSPVLFEKLTAPRRTRRAEAAELKAQQEKFAAEAAKAAEAAFREKLANEADSAKRAAMIQAREAAQVTARQAELDLAKAARKATRSKLGEHAGGAALLLVVGGPLIWSLARPWIEPGLAVLGGLWWFAALVYAPAPTDGDEPAEDQADDEGPDEPSGEDDHDGEDQDDEDDRTPPAPLTDAELAASVEHMVAIRAQADGGAGNLLIAEVLAALQWHGHYPGHDTRKFGAAVRAAGIPPKPSVGVGSGPARTTSPGWSVAYLRTLLGRDPRLPPAAVPDHTLTKAA
ncbi:hypothetical protein ACFYS8_36280 [Kitasatospora sp. NPDC004615]|uniref:hypothetical protein n=1 Tax=Kitasatospora sp. NPDC004615 TaxID=3364017 RepID=UPI00368BD999